MADTAQPWVTGPPEEAGLGLAAHEGRVSLEGNKHQGCFLI